MVKEQDAVIAFLATPGTFGDGGPVDRVETHGAIVFLCGDEALKLKRAVTYDYMDFGTPGQRRRFLLREIDLNRAAAPSIYRDVVPVTRDARGRLALNGAGTPVDWVLRMRRFSPEDELEAIAARGALDDALAGALGHGLAAYHAAAPLRDSPGARLIGDILDELERVFTGLADDPSRQAELRWLAAARARWAADRTQLDRRGCDGWVRRGHGDLHLGNLVVIDGAPVPFDALEFDETLGTCDLLYDLGFLLMDLCHRDLRRAACRVLDAWLAAFDGAQDAGLGLLPLFLSVRAAIRAMVLLQTDRARAAGPSAGPDHAAEAARYLDEALAFLAPPAPVLLAVGGFSGSGKSRLARALAPHLGAAPGAVWLASDVLRKAGRDPVAALPGAAYAPAARQAVYAAMRARATAVLTAGHSAILDATFLDPQERDRARALADTLGVAFSGLWLDAPETVLRQRIASRRGDPSDAGISVLEQQLAKGTGALDWHRIDATASDTDLVQAALSVTRPPATPGR
ncbi:MAG: AAA family ATPase [Paracoccaceae bacterium]